jgi:hypothetical protein
VRLLKNRGGRGRRGLRGRLLRGSAAIRRTAGDTAGAVADLEEAVRLRDALAKRDASFVARLGDLDDLLAQARASGR